VTNFEVKVRIIDTVNFRPGMTATVDIQSQRAKGVFALPIQAVTTRKDTAGGDEKLECVFEYKDGEAHMIIVKTGIQDDEFIQILSGVTDSLEIIKGPYSAVSRLIEDGSLVLKEGGEESSSGMSFSVSVQ
jgi:HlyD family secretion protein